MALAAPQALPDDKLPIVTVRDKEFTPATYNNPELAERLATTASPRNW